MIYHFTYQENWEYIMEKFMKYADRIVYKDLEFYSFGCNNEIREKQKLFFRKLML